MDKWFICQNEKVTGPYSGDEVKAQFAGGELPQGCLIWGRPQNEWQSVEWWIKDGSRVTNNFLSQSNENAINSIASAPVASTAAEIEAVIEQVPPAQQQWHYAVDGASKGPLSRVELINEIRGIRNKNEVLVWTKGMKAWSDLYSFHDLIDELGLNKREHPRASIVGSVVIRTETNALLGQLKSISAGGFGATQLDPTIAIGQLFTVEIKAEELGETINAKATVQYISDQGYVGCKFQTVSMEAKSRITDYIMRTRLNPGMAA